MVTIPLELVTEHDVEQVGGKALGLARARRAGAPVPHGFVIPSKTFPDIGTGPEWSEYRDVLRHISPADIKQLLTLSRRWREALSSWELPPGSRALLLSAFESLSADRVAVRSSGGDEDGAAASWAGQFETLLNVRREALIEAVMRCWSSVVEPGALAYRIACGRVDAPWGMAVLIQPMIEPDYAGVAFSVDPRSGARDEIIVEAVTGLGDSLVSGERVPVRVFVTRESQSMRVDARAADVREYERLLDAVPSLAATVLSLEAAASHPVDIEWAVRDGHVWVLQMRPLTAIGDGTDRVISEDEFDFSWSEYHPIISAEAWPQSYIEHGDLPANGNQRAFIYVENGLVTSYFWRGDSEYAAREGGVLCDPSSFERFLQSSREARDALESLHQTVVGCDLDLLSNGELADMYAAYQSLFNRHYALYKLSQPEFTETAAAELRSCLDSAGPLGRSESDSFVVLTTLDQADIVREEERHALELSLKGLDQAQMRDHAERFPWLCFNTFDQETVDRYLLAKFADLNALPEEARRKRLAEIEAELEHARKERADLLAALASPRIKYLSDMFVELSLDRYRLKASWAGAEYRFLPLFNTISRRLGIKLEVLLGCYRADDIVTALRDGRLVSEEERSARRRYTVLMERGECRFLSGEEAVRLRDALVGSTLEATDDAVQGSVAFPGRAVGRARVIIVEGLQRLLEDMEAFQDGEVLVTTMTQPTMVCLARRAAAIVTNEGGITSHAAILARELKIPCVVGTHRGTLVFKDGDTLEVDADRGIVRRVGTTS